MSVWVTYFYDVGPIVAGIFATEIEARRSVGDSAYMHVIEVPLPCEDVDEVIHKK